MSEDFAYGYEDGYADERRHQARFPVELGEYRRGYEAGVRAARESALEDHKGMEGQDQELPGAPT